MKAYWKSPGIKPEMAKALAAHVAPGARQTALLALAQKAPVRATADKAGIQWVRIPGGTFSMGTDEWSYTKPVHSVTVKSFQMAKTLVTNKQYGACVSAGACTAAHVSDGTCWVYDVSRWAHGGSLPSSFLGDDQPVVCVDWEQAKAFAAWAGGRLPSESEWEYAARSGGKDRKYPWGDEEATCETAVISQGGNGCGRSSTWPVCSKPKGNTEQGLCDMAGNAWEWVEDCYHGSYSGAPADGSAWESPTGSYRVTRGGSWNYGASFARAAYRYFDVPARRFANFGLRVAR